jgi:hypothetical protein
MQIGIGIATIAYRPWRIIGSRDDFGSIVYPFVLRQLYILLYFFGYYLLKPYLFQIILFWAPQYYA